MEDELVKYSDGCVRVGYTGNREAVRIGVGGGGRGPRELFGGGKVGVLVRGGEELRSFGGDTLDPKLGRYWSRCVGSEFLGLCEKRKLC